MSSSTTTHCRTNPVPPPCTFRPTGAVARASAAWRRPRESELGAVAFPVRASRLDDFALEGVGFVKIDVEGHELAVLQGSRETIARDRPVVVVEIEERFHPDGAWRDVFAWFAVLGYRGSVFASGAWRPETDVDWLHAQRGRTPDGSLLAMTFAARLYLRNFVFVPEEHAS